MTRKRTAAPARLIDSLRGRLAPEVALFFQHPSAGRLILDRQGALVRANDPLRRMLGPAADLSAGTPVLRLVVEADRDAVWAALAAALAGTPGRPLAARLLAAGPAPLAVALTATPLREADGGSSGALVTLKDDSAQARLATQLAQAQRLQAAGQLAGGIAHDFNNLLTAILGAADAVGAIAGLPADAAEELALIRAGVARGSALVRQLLAFGRRQTLQPRVLAVNQVLTDIAALLRRLLGSRVRLELGLEQPGPAVRADPTALDQVLLNLAVNARDAMPQGGTLTLRSGHMTLRRPLPRGPETIPPGRYAMIEVQDTGSGIPPELVGRIFEPFFTTRREQGGTGLGLATVHGIVRQSGGFLAVESAPGHGTRLRVYLPRCEDAAVAAPAPPPPAAPLRADIAAPRSVLLVDDEPTVRQVAARALTRHGWHVLAAESAEDALALLDVAAPPALAAVVTDLVMPGEDGTALVRAIRARLHRPALPAILVSGYATEALRLEVAAALPGDATMFLPKPYEIADLAARLRDVTEGPGVSSPCVPQLTNI